MAAKPGSAYYSSCARAKRFHRDIIGPAISSLGLNACSQCNQAAMSVLSIALGTPGASTPDVAVPQSDASLKKLCPVPPLRGSGSFAT